MNRPSLNEAQLGDALMLDLEDSSFVGAVMVSEDGKVIAANQAFLKFLGYGSVTEVAGRASIQELLARESDRNRWRAAADSSQFDNVELQFTAKGGEPVLLHGSIDARGGPKSEMYVRGIFTDATAKLQLDAMSLDMARMQAVSSLAAGVSHDFNNLLTVLVGNLYLVAESVRQDADVFDKVKRARDAARRGADLTRSLLAFARGGDVEASVVELGRVVDRLAPLLKAAVGSKIQFETQIAPELASISVNLAQLESVITNLVINARDAVDSEESGKVVLSVRNRDVDTSESKTGRLAAGRYVELSVIDNGCGMSEDIRKRAFRPFFTTKGPGKGTGLGLAMVGQFVKSAGGAVSVRSGEGKGTTIKCILPSCEATASNTMTGTMPLAKLQGGNECVLIVSNDPEFRHTASQILGALGYTVSTDTPDNRALWTDSQTKLSVIVMDDSVTERYVQNIVAVSKRIGRSVGMVFVGANESRFATGQVRIGKPFSLPELSKAVRRAIEGNRDGTAATRSHHFG